MSYMALYRKWRPDNFEDVKGQEHVVTTLKNQVKHERIGHAYLFCGTRGTGKTTVAKIMAKVVNCENPVDGSPCNECASCKAIANGSSLNVIEIDAASNNGVDNIRQINNAVQYSPSTGKYLVYIIDEVHMLSQGAFNALLKTLEEPPAYVIFILATTEYHKIPITILSRCQRYDFKRIANEVISARLSELLVKENIAFTEDAVNYIARAADGSMRDSLSILDQCIAYNLGKELTYDRVLETIGAVDIVVYKELINAINSQDVSTAVDIVDKAIVEGKDLSQFVGEFITFIRNVLMLKLNADMTVDLTSEHKKELIELAEKFREGELINYINILQEASTKINYATAKRVVLEVAVIKLCKPQMQNGVEAIEKRMDMLESAVESGLASISAAGAATAAVSGGEQVVYVKQESDIVSRFFDSETAEKYKRNELSAEQKKELEEKILEQLRESYDEATLDELKLIAAMSTYIKEHSVKPVKMFMDSMMLTPGDEPGYLRASFEDVEANSLAIAYFEQEKNRKDFEIHLSELMGRKISIEFRKVNSKQVKEEKIDLHNILGLNIDGIAIERK